MLKVSLGLYLVLLFSMMGQAQNIVPALIERDTILTRASAPHYLHQNLTIEEGITLEIESGVQVFLSQGVAVNNLGRLLISGTSDEPVIFTTEAPELRWAYISNRGTLLASHMIVRRAVRFVTSYGDTLVLDHCDVADTYGGVGDDCIGVHNAKKVSIRNSSIIGNPEAGKTDALDLDGISNDSIEGNYIAGFSDDGIDIGTGSQNITISNNVIENCDMAISIGENSTAMVRKNLLTHSGSGIQSHTGSVVLAQQNTLFGNRIGLRALHYSNELSSGGTIQLSNSIIASSGYAELIQVENSIIQFEYCLTDLELMPGQGNLMGDPLFADEENASFELLPASMAIDAGNPDNDNDGLDYTVDMDDTDPDGSRLDMGCFPYFHSSLKFVEVSPSNLSLMSDDSGVYSDWFKIINLSESTINLKGYYLSDKFDNNLKYQLNEDLYVSSGDTVIFWANGTSNPSHNQVPFKLSGEGETLVISDSQGVMMDKITFPRVPVNYLYRQGGTQGRWIFSTFPPGDEALIYDGLCNSPAFSNPGGASTFPLSTALSPYHPNDSVFYTLDGTNPIEGTLLDSSLVIQEALTLRTVMKKAKHLPGYIGAETYYAKEDYNLPVLSISTNEENLYGSIGIYSNYGKSGPAWERPASFSYDDGHIHFSSIAGIRIQGGNSVFMPKKAFRMHFRGGYGNSELRASPFKSGPSSFKNLVLRSGYDDDITNYDGTLLRDPFSTELWSRLGELSTKSTFGALLLNNNYWGIYNIRESINEYFVADNMDIVDFDLVRFQKWGTDLKYGTMDEWNHLLSYFDTTDFSRPEVYDEVSAFMDMNSLLNLLAMVHCSQFRSWTWGAFVVKPKGGRWSWTIWDSDRAYNTLDWNGFTEYAITTNEKWPNFIPQKLILNERFSKALINRNCDLINSLFVPATAIAMYDSLVAVLAPEIDAEFERWKPDYRNRWDINNESIREFLRNRPARIYDQMKSYFGIDDTVHITVRIEGRGKVELNTLSIDQETWQGVYMSGIPVSLDAIPSPGSKFVEWRGISTMEHIEIDPGVSHEITAVFDTSSLATHEPIVINEIMYHPQNTINSEWIELYNPNDFSVSLAGYEFSDGGLDNHFIFPSDAIINPLDFFVVAGDLSDYRSEFISSTNLSGSFNSGSTGFMLNNNGEDIYLKNGYGEEEDYVPYDNSVPWPDAADGYGPSLQLISPDLDNSNPSNWYASITNPYTPGKQNTGNSSSEEIHTKEQLLRIYPNPVGATLFIEVHETFGPEMHISLYSLTGKNVANAAFHTADHQGFISWNHGIKDPGAYLLQIFSGTRENNHIHTQLLIVHRND